MLLDEEQVNDICCNALMNFHSSLEEYHHWIRWKVSRISGCSLTQIYNITLNHSDILIVVNESELILHDGVNN